ncbi:PAS domain S-box protein [Halobellus ordinarius]|uniref:PAS domain S-box protein n=1 Tax=Halobellus ordinarius TaxID=3075120 RepID=UPI0028803AC5|nr:PAS domain S-box protein [Halobellus sp. ZY16]
MPPTEHSAEPTEAATDTDGDPLDDLLEGRAVSPEIEGPPTIYPLLADSGNQRVLAEWLDGHDTYRAADVDTPIADAEFDLCITDEGALREFGSELKRLKANARPVLLPVLLLLPEQRTDVIGIDDGEIADNVFATTIDEIVSLPIRQTELAWRIRALLRLRSQSLQLQARTSKLELFRRAVEDSGHAVYITDRDGTIKYVNPAFEDITGYSASEAVGQTPQLLNSGEMPDSYFEELWETVLAGDVWSAEVIDRRKDGELYYADQTIAPVTDGEGRFVAFVAVQRDITERKQREETLERRTQAIERAPIGVSISNPKEPDNPLIYVNEAFEELMGYSREEAVGRNCRFPQGENTDSERVARIREAIEAEEPIAIDIRNYRKDGTEFWNHLNIAPVRDDEGEVLNYVGFQQDVTDRKQREAQLRILGRILRHNLRNDINVIQGRAESIQARCEESIADEAQRIIDKSGELMALAEKERAITEVLSEPPRPVDIDLEKLIERVVDDISGRFSGVSIETDCQGELTVSASDHFGTALEELVENAVVHNDHETTEVGVSARREADNVRLTVRDDGSTIPEMERAVLLGDEGQTATFHGSGLGLWLVNLIVSRTGGSISHEPNGAGGNVVEIVLPQ